MTNRQPKVGQRLAAARLQRSLSQGTVARRAGIAPSYLSRIENDKVQPTFRTVSRVARAMQLSFSELAGGEANLDGRVCPVSRSGHCLLDLIHSDVGKDKDPEGFTTRQVRLLRRFAAWVQTVPADRQRAMEVLLDDLTRATKHETPEASDPK
jgi:DNA-binding XRE family transcriptional regulator